MAEEKTWQKNKKAYNLEYDRLNKVRIGVKLNKATEPELVDIYQRIPNKAQWFKDCLRRYAQEHPEIFTNKSDPEDCPE
jgi:hypothetical protein